METNFWRMILRLPVSMGLFALVLGGILVLVFGSTQHRIIEAEQKFRLKQLYEVCQLDTVTESVNIQKLPTAELKKPSGTNISALSLVRTHSGQLFYIVEFTAPDGYSGDIDVLMALTAKGTIKGVRVVKHRETPGLGDKVERRKSDWITGFDTIDLATYSEKQWTVQKDDGVFAAFAGATITPKAVIKAVYNALVFFENYRAFL